VGGAGGRMDSDRHLLPPLKGQFVRELQDAIIVDRLKTQNAYDVVYWKLWYALHE
jgi:hypothetical protein